MEKITIISKRENPLLNRKEVEIAGEFNVTPKMSEAESLLSNEFSSSAENVRIKKIKGKFGSKKFLIVANIYNSKEDKERIEPKSKKLSGEKK